MPAPRAPWVRGGRPHLVTFVASAAERDTIRNAAAKRGQSVSDFVRQAALKAAGEQPVER